IFPRKVGELSARMGKFIIWLTSCKMQEEEVGACVFILGMVHLTFHLGRQGMYILMLLMEIFIKIKMVLGPLLGILEGRKDHRGLKDPKDGEWMTLHPMAKTSYFICRMVRRIPSHGLYNGDFLRLRG